MTEFDISPLFECSELVKTVYVYSNTNTSIDERGDSQETQTLRGSDSAIVISAQGNNDWQNRGVIVDHDYDVFFKEETSMSSYLIDGNLLSIDGISYMIREVTHNPGHYEISAKR